MRHGDIGQGRGSVLETHVCELADGQSRQRVTGLMAALERKVNGDTAHCEIAAAVRSRLIVLAAHVAGAKAETPDRGSRDCGEQRKELIVGVQDRATS